MLSEEARKRKVAYNVKRNKEKYKKFAVNLLIPEYEEICDYLKQMKMNKAEFIRWAYDKLRQED
jgi:hypothetical protein